jgi:hypothetical protein
MLVSFWTRNEFQDVCFETILKLWPEQPCRIFPRLNGQYITPVVRKGCVYVHAFFTGLK